jgi:hypothetical protein
MHVPPDRDVFNCVLFSVADAHFTGSTEVKPLQSVVSDINFYVTQNETCDFVVVYRLVVTCVVMRI